MVLEDVTEQYGLLTTTWDIRHTDRLGQQRLHRRDIQAPEDPAQRQQHMHGEFIRPGASIRELTDSQLIPGGMPEGN